MELQDQETNKPTADARENPYHLRVRLNEKL